MSILTDMKNRHIQRKANSFIASLSKKSEKEIEQAYLDNKEFENNEIVLSYLFFNHTSLIRILPIEFQKKRINSNLNMFKYGSDEAKKELVSDWLKDNKFFMNALVVEFNDEEYEEYIKLYFKQPDDVALLFMDDLRTVIDVLSKQDLKQTEEIINRIKDKLTDRQWDYILEVNPMFVKYANQDIQDKYSDDEKYAIYLSGEARNKFIKKQIKKIDEDISILDSMPIDVKTEYITLHPTMVNYLSDETLIEVLKYDIELIKYVNLTINKNKEDKTQEVVCGILENIQNKSNKEIINILVNKCLLNAKGKLYRFDPNSNDVSYQYTKRIIKIIQSLTIEQIKVLIMVDVNYILPYIVPLYNNDTPREMKEKIITDCNSRCLNVFKSYYGKEIYEKFYRLINKIFFEYANHLDKYDYSIDYRCIFDLLKVLFNKKLLLNNSVEKITIFVGTSLTYKDTENVNSKKLCVRLLNEILSSGYAITINNNREIYNINSLELFDKRFDFIKEELLLDYSKFNFVNTSNLLLIVKSDKVYNLFKKYYEIITYIYGENTESLYRAVENFNYYRELLEDIEGKELNDEEIDNLTLLLSVFGNPQNITKKEELSDYDINLFKKLVSDVSKISDQDSFKNLLCNYLFNKSYDEKGNVGWLESATIKNFCDIYEPDSLESLTIDDNRVFDDDEVNLFTMTKLLFESSDSDLLLSFIENIISNKVKRNILSILELFNKIKQYRVELINNQIVSLQEIEDLYESRPDTVVKSFKDGIEVYTIVGQDFRILCSTNDDGIHYRCVNVSKLDKNSYVYNRLEKVKSIRFTTEDGNTFIKLNKDNLSDNNMKASFIIVVGKLNDELLQIARENNLKIVEIQSE